MEKNAEEKSLEKINKNSIFSKIKKFFKNLFSKNKNADVSTEENTNDNIIDTDKKNSFMEDVKKVEDEETSILKLQTKYRKGEIGEKDLTAEQIDALCEQAWKHSSCARYESRYLRLWFEVKPNLFTSVFLALFIFFL